MREFPLPHDPDSPTAFDFSLLTYRYYATLMQHASACSGADGRGEASLGGQLLWTGELDAAGRALVVLPIVEAPRQDGDQPQSDQYFGNIQRAHWTSSRFRLYSSRGCKVYIGIRLS